MKFITNNLERWVTAIVLLAVTIIVGIINNDTLMWVYLGAFYFIAFDEAIKLFEIQRKAPYTYAAIIWVIAYFYPNPDDLFFVMAIFFGAKLAYTQEHIKKKLLIPFLYPVSGFLFALVLYRDFGIQYMLWLLIIVAITDTAAFFVGKSVGKTPFSPTSPNKTLEGVIGGISFATITGAIIGLYLCQTDFIIALLVSFSTSVASIFGDLFESYLKREAGVKDSGNILPGHGGVLDRLDGYLFGSIVMLITLRAF